MPVNQALNTFQDACNSADTFVTRAHSQDSSGNFFLNVDERDLVTVAAFLRMFIAWETFLETTFLLYMVGTPSRLGANITTYVHPLNLEHARNILVGNQRFIDWSTPDTVRILSQSIFDNGAPFAIPISSCHADLLDMKTVRNATAHTTLTTMRTLDGLATRKLGHPVANTTAAAFLLSTLPGSAPPVTLFRYYMDIVLTAASLIANG